VSRVDAWVRTSLPALRKDLGRGFKGSRVQGFKGSRVQGFKGSRVKELKSKGLKQLKG
jgi:hypothetical protein